MLIISFKRVSAKKINFGIPIISIGNLIVGGSGKTPLAIALAKDKENVCVILRGYGRESKGLHVISQKGKLLEDIKISGDEAMLLANALPQATIIVSEDRKEAIVKAKELGSELIFLDDGFSKYDIFKYDILIRPKKEPTNEFCLPSGGYREPKMMYAFADMVLKEGEDFTRVVNFKQNDKILDILPSKVLLLTAISKPQRLTEFLPQTCEMVAFPDHYAFTQTDIDVIANNYKGFTIITTAKDLVKLKKFDIKDIILMDLELEVTKDLKQLETFIS